MTPARRWPGFAPWLLAAALAASALAAFGMGLRQAWARNGDGDMQLRVDEYAAFRAGDYPNPAADGPVGGRKVPFTVYPPYAFPMFAAFFEPGGLVQGRIVIEVLTVAAFIVLGFYGRDRLKPFGTSWATVGALAGVGMASNGSTIALGQFSTLCAGLVVLQMMLLRSGRSTAAGLCWAGAMIKPQIGVAFAVLFLVNRQIRGFLCGIAVLTVLSLGALWWTETSPVALAHHWLFRVQMKFAIDASGYGPGHLAEWLGLNHRLTHYAALAALAVLGMVAAAIAGFARCDIAVPDLLPLAGMCAVLGRVLTYHRHYDNSMLFPLLVAWLSIAVATPTAANVVTAGAVGLTLWIPQRIQHHVPLVEFLQPAIWIVAGVRLAAVAVGTRHGTAPAGLRPGPADSADVVHRV